MTLNKGHMGTVRSRSLAMKVYYCEVLAVIFSVFSIVCFSCSCLRFSRRVIWLEADVTNKRPEVIAEYYLDAIQNLNGK